MKRFLKWLSLLIAALALLITVFIFNPALFKQPLERYLGGLTGHSVFLGGDIDLNLGRTIEITAGKIRVASPAWARHPNLVELDELKLSLLLSSIFEEKVVIESLHLDNLQLRLESDAEGKDNWEIPRHEVEKSQETGKNRRFIFKALTLSNADIRFNNQKTKASHVLLVESFNQQQLQDGLLQSELKGMFNNRRVEYSGKIGPYENILGDRDIQFESDGYFGELKISGKGLIDSIREPKNPTFMLNLEGPNIDEITAMLGIDDLGGGGFSLSAKGGQVKDHYEAGINGSIGDVSLHVSAVASDVSKWHKLDLAASSNGPSLGAVMRAFGIERWPDQPFNIKAAVQKTGRTLDVSDLLLSIGDTHLQMDALLTRFPDLNASHVKLNISGEDMSPFKDLLGIPGLAAGHFDLKAKLNVTPGGLEFVQVDMESPVGKASISGNLAEAPTYRGSKFRLVFDGPSAQALLPGLTIKALPDKPFNLNTDLELVDRGLLINQGVFLSNENERYDLSGLISFNKDLEGSDLDVKASGENLARFLRRLEISNAIPERPYQVSSKVKIIKNGLELTDTRASFESIHLNTNGLVTFENEISGSFLNFDLSHENISKLSAFDIIGDSLDIFAPGLSLQSSGRLDFDNNNWKLGGVKGRLGNAAFDFDALISKQPAMAGSKIRFSVNGPGVQGLLSQKAIGTLDPGPFKATGQLQLSDKALIGSDLTVETAATQGSFNFELAWPVNELLKVHFDVDAHGQNIRSFLPPLDSFEAAESGFKLKTEGRIENHQIALKSFKAAIGNLELNMAGRMQNDPNDAATEFTLMAKSPDISGLGSFDGQALPALPLDLSAEVSSNTGLFSIRELNGSLGNSKLNLTLDVSMLQPKPSIKVMARSDFIDFEPFSSFIELDEPDQKESTEHAPEERLIPATPLPLDLLNSVDVDADIEIVELKLQKSTLKDLKLDLVVLDGALQLHELSLNAPRGTLKTSLTVQPLNAAKASVKLDLNASNLFFNLSGVPSDQLNEIPAWNIEAHAVGGGANFQELAGSANGAISIKSSGGLLKGINMSLLDTFLLEEIFSWMMPKTKKAPDTRLSCSATILSIEDGIVKTNPALTFFTDKIAIITTGTLNLKNEKLNLGFNATPQNAMKISAGELFNSFLVINGTLANPTVGLDPGKTALHGGVAVGTAGISLLAKGLLDRMGNKTRLCEELLQTPLQN